MTPPTENLEALFVVIHDSDHLQDVLLGLVEIGITTATILESQGMGSVVSQEMSVFAGFRDLWAGAGGYNHTLFAVVDSETAEEAIEVLQDIMMGYPEQGRGVVFTLPVARFRSLSPRPDASD